MMIVCGLYAVLWGQSKEMKKKMTILETTRMSENDEHVAISHDRVIQSYQSSAITNQ